MATLADRLRHAINELVTERTNSTEVIEEIIRLSKSHDVDDIAVPGTGDCTEALQGALTWGLKKYGPDLYRGYGFFVALVDLGRMLPHT